MKLLRQLPEARLIYFHWRVPNPPGANPLVAERAPWRSSQSCVTRGQQPIGNPYRFLSFLLHTWQPLCDPPTVTREEDSFSYQGVSTRGVRHALVSLEEDKRAATNVQSGLVFFFLFSFV